VSATKAAANPLPMVASPGTLVRCHSCDNCLEGIGIEICISGTLYQLQHSPEDQTILGHRIDDTRHGEHGAEHGHRESSGGSDGHHRPALGGIHVRPHLDQRRSRVDVVIGNWEMKEKN